MAEQDDSADRTEQPTQKRLDDARKKGQIPRSVDLSAAVVSIAAAGAIYLFGTKSALGLLEMMTQSLTISRLDLAYPDIMFRELAASAWAALWAIVPLLGATVLAAIAAPAIIGGWNFSGESMGFKADRLDPLKGIARMFSLRSAVELLKAVAKFAFVGGVGIAVIGSQVESIAALAAMPVSSAIVSSAGILAFALLSMTGALAIIALIDAPFQVFQHNKELRMTRQEIRDEYKESDGNPENKARIRGVQAQLSRSRMMQEVPRATVIVTNPTHFAVALRYDESRDRAPVVVAKGADEVAANIREIGNQHGVPLVFSKKLARVLFRHVDLGREVPSPLYVAIAQILTYVYQLQAAARFGVDRPAVPVVDPQIESLELKGRVH